MMRVLIIFLLLAFTFASRAQPAAKLLPEQTILNTDKNFYISGQIIWFKTYVLSADLSHVQAVSKSAYAELINPQGIPVMQTRIKLQDGAGNGSFALAENAASGTYALRVYTNWMKQNAASVYSKPVTVINTGESFDTTAFYFKESERPGMQMQRDSDETEVVEVRMQPGKLSVVADQKVYDQRSAVKLTLNNEEAHGELANVSVSVFKLNQLTDPRSTKSMQPHIESNGDFIDQGEAILPEMNGFTVAVSARNRNGNPVADVPVIASVSGKLADAQSSQTDEGGIAYFNFKGVYGERDLLLKTTAEFQNQVELRAMNSYLQPSHPLTIGKSVLSYDDLAVVEEMHNHHVVSKAFERDSAVLFLPENLDSLSFYGKPYATYLLDNYKRFVTMEEVLREYVREVSVRIRNKNYYIPVFNRQNYDLRKYLDINAMIDENPPLILIDGIPVTANQLIKYDPLKVRKLEVMADRYALGKILYDGILSFTTYKGNYPDLELDPADLLVDMHGWQYQRIFQMPDYSDLLRKNSRLPDFRELLYWNPAVVVPPKQPAEVTFFTGDLTGDFLIEVQGVTTDGKVVEARSVLQVVQ